MNFTSPSPSAYSTTSRSALVRPAWPIQRGCRPIDIIFGALPFFHSFGSTVCLLFPLIGGVRVVKGYHAEAREAEVFSEGVERLLQNVFKSLSMMSLMALSSTVLMGLVSAAVMYFGARQIFAGTLTPGDFIMFTAFLAMMIAPIFQMVGIGTQLTEAFAGLDRMREAYAHAVRERYRFYSYGDCCLLRR